MSALFWITQITFPKNKALFHEAVERAYYKGKEDGANETAKRVLSDLKHKQIIARTDALKVLTEFYRGAGQAGSVMAEAMKSEAGQL